MVTLSASAAALLAVFAGGWLAVALWATLRGRRTAVLATSQRRDIARLDGLLASGPAVKRRGAGVGFAATALPP